MLTREQAIALIDKGDFEWVFCVMTCDDSIYAAVGYHIVNVEQYYKSAKKMPPNLECDDVWFTDGGLPAP